jgi:tricorn protease-like protein
MIFRCDSSGHVETRTSAGKQATRQRINKGIYRVCAKFFVYRIVLSEQYCLQSYIIQPYDERILRDF